MNKDTILHLNVLPEGKEAWLSYDQYQELKQVFEAVELPSDEGDIQSEAYLKLYDFLTNVAHLSVPMKEEAIHFNAFALIRRGYKIEEITDEEYEQLLELMATADQANIDDMSLYDFGRHRDLYNFLTHKMGLSVRAGRGPVWHRAKDLLNHYQVLHSQNQLS